MKTIAINSIKGGTGKTTLAVLLINALTNAGYRRMGIDADASNNSLSAYFDNNEPAEQHKTVFNLFIGEKPADCVTRIRDNLDLVCGDVRLNEFRGADSIKRLKRALHGHGLAYDFCIIDTSPNYDNIIGNVLTASDILLIPVEQDVFSYHAVKYQFEKLTDLELDGLDTYIILNRFERPLTDNQEAYRHQITNLFLADDALKPFINPNRISRSSAFRKYINKRNYLIGGKAETQKAYGEINALIQSILGIEVKEAF
jgi:chromosome partitioning protein